MKTTIADLKNFSCEENTFLESAERDGVIDLNALSRIVSNKPFHDVKTIREIEVARKGIRFCTRFKFKLEDIVEDCKDGTMMFRNFYRIDYIENIYNALRDTSCSNFLWSGENKQLVVPSTIVPLSDCWIFYRFPTGMFDLSTELTGCIFGNTLRILYNRVKIIYSNEFFIKYDYPYILTPYVGGTKFGVKIETDAL